MLDYHDLLLAWAQVVEKPPFAVYLGGMSDHLLIYEHRDTNRLQARILMALKPTFAG